MPAIRKTKRQLGPRDYVIIYVLYGVLIVLASVVAFVIWPPVIVAVTLVLTNNSMWVHRGVYPFAMVLIGMGWLALVVTAEGYLRNGMERQELRPRFRRLALPLALLGALGLLLGYVAT